jgi:alkanesulfonate monooxygenase
MQKLNCFATLNHLFSRTDEGDDLLTVLLKDGPQFLRAAEAAGFEGVLIFSANRLPNPFFVAQMVMAETRSLIPLIALRADLSHPFEVYSRLVAIAALGKRPISLNLVAGANRYEQIELGDTCPHDERYLRLAEFAAILRQLIRKGGRCKYVGNFFQLNVEQPMARPDWPEITYYVSGSSEAAVELSSTLEATRIAPWESDLGNAPRGVPLGLLVRPTCDDAWQAADAAFPHHRAEVRIPEMNDLENDSKWRDRLLAEASAGLHVNCERPAWWYAPYLGTRLHRSGRRSNHVWLVGSYEVVAAELAELRHRGVTDVIVYQESAADTQHIDRLMTCLR